MKNFRITYKLAGVTCKKYPVQIVKASSADEAVRMFQEKNRWAFILAVFAA